MVTCRRLAIAVFWIVVGIVFLFLFVLMASIV